MEMVAKELINQNIPTIPIHSSVEESLKIFNDSTYDCLPIVDSSYCVGLLQYLDLEVQDKNEKIKNLSNIVKNYSITEESLFLEMLESFLKNRASIIPVVSHEGIYTGAVLFDDFMDYCTDTLYLFHEGTTFDVLLTSDKKISDVIFLIESEGANVLSLLPRYSTPNALMSLSIKINKKNAEDVFSLLRLKKYKVIENTSTNDTYKEMYKKRIDEFFKYMNI